MDQNKNSRVEISALRVDHLVFGVHDLDRGVDRFEQLTGVRAVPGGRHVGRGTHNALIGLGPELYLEIIAPDPTQPNPVQHRAFGLDNLSREGLLTWAVKESHLDQAVVKAEEAGINLGGVLDGSRNRPDGSSLSWHYTSPSQMNADGLVPFFIDWGNSRHPADDLESELELTYLRAEHPYPELVRKQLSALNIDLLVTPASSVALIAIIDTPGGPIELS